MQFLNMLQIAELEGTSNHSLAHLAYLQQGVAALQDPCSHYFHPN